MDETAFKEGLAILDSLALEEYQQPLEDISADPDPLRVAGRVGRLVGVMLKEPFAVAHTLDVPSEATAAHRAWILVDEAAFDSPDLANSWQYHALERICEEEHYSSVYNLIEVTQTERGLFRPFAQNVGRYLCGEASIRKEVEDALRQGKLPAVTPERVVASGGVALGAYLVQAIPIVGMVGVPCVAALVLILYKIGLKSFCGPVTNVQAREDK